MPIFINIDLSSLLIQMEETIEAPPSKVFEAMTGDISAWWGFPLLIDPEDAMSVTIEPWLGGMFYESWRDGGGIVLGMVSRLKRDRRLTLQGYVSLPGPLCGVIDFELVPTSNDSTLLKLSHSAFGSFDWQAERHYKSGWRNILGTRLKQYIEKGYRRDFR